MSSELESAEGGKSNDNDNNEESPESEQDERLVKSKKAKESKRQQAFVRSLLIFGILVLVNIISINIFFRLDLTANKIYTLSPASKILVKNLDDKLVVKAYFTDGLPSPYNNTRRYLKEILDDYRNYSNGNFNYEIISPSDEQVLEDDAQRYGIQPVQVQTFKNDRAEAMKAYMGLVFLYSGKQETLPFIGNVQNLEYEITGVLRRLVEKELKKVAILQGQGMPTIDKIGKVNQYLSKYYNMTTVDASKNNPVPGDIATLLVFSPKNEQRQQMMQQQQQPPMKIPENLKFAVDQYIMSGGKVIFLLNKVSVSSQQNFQFAQAVPVGLEDMLESYGIKFNDDIIKDKDCAYVSVPVQSGPLQFYTQVPFPYYPKITNISKNIPAFSGIGQVYLSFTSDLDTTAATFKGLKVTPLLTTSPKTAADKEISVIMQTGKMLPDSMFKTGNLVVGSIYAGKFASFYKGKSIPADTATGSSPAPASIKEISPDTKIIAIGNGDFALDDFRGPDENLVFFSNMIDYMTDDVGLAEIRLKDANPKSIKPIEDSTRNILKYGLLVAPPVLVLVFGIWRWRRRSAAK
jgi:gliding-associated putative ABC transporter substrate-binding component GldG